MGLCVLSSSNHSTTGVDYVGENATGTQEYIVAAGNAFIDGDVVLHLDIPSQDHSWRDHNILPNVAVFSQNSSWHDVAKMPYFASFANA
jgi:hypothetical protein